MKAAERDTGRIRNNPPGTAILVWVCESGAVLEIPPGHKHAQAVPDPIAANPDLVRDMDMGKGTFARVNRAGFFRGAVLNQRLYVWQEMTGATPPHLVRSLRPYAQKKRLTRGIVIERPRLYYSGQV